MTQVLRKIILAEILCLFPMGIFCHFRPSHVKLNKLFRITRSTSEV